MTSLTLSALTTKIQETIRMGFDTPVWIRAEIAELREGAGGHCYIELIEKDAESDTIVAKSKASIWSSTYRMLKPYFESSTAQTLCSGLNVLIAVTVEFHGVYGFNLNVRDIDPTYTIGEMAARRIKIIRQLEADGVVEMNKILVLPSLPQRIAIISSSTAAGYGDFCDQLKNDSNNYVFYTKLYPAIMQGEQAMASIISALDKINENIEMFDVVLILRGGGATSDLACFDSYELAYNCSQFPLPIIAGIGHQRDISILDMVAHTSLKTPTAVADFLISCLQNEESLLINNFNNIQYNIKEIISNELYMISNGKQRIKHALRNSIIQKSMLLERIKARCRSVVNMQMMQQHNRLLMLEKNIETHSPVFLLKHGYTISTLNGKRINSVHQLSSGDVVRTYLHDGEFGSKVL